MKIFRGIEVSAIRMSPLEVIIELNGTTSREDASFYYSLCAMITRQAMSQFQEKTGDITVMRNGNIIIPTGFTDISSDEELVSVLQEVGLSV